MDYTEKQLVDLAGNSFTGAVLSAWSLAILGCAPWGVVLAVPRERGDGVPDGPVPDEQAEAEGDSESD
eukprot:7923847-Pyramimonas_sp.AAC.1